MPRSHSPSITPRHDAVRRTGTKTMTVALVALSVRLAAPQRLNAGKNKGDCPGPPSCTEAWVANCNHPSHRGGHWEPYAVFEVKRSSGIRGLERMNSVHPYHRRDRYEQLRHFVFTFHDSTFECVADGYEISIRSG